MIDLIFWWVGAVVCGAGALAALTFVVAFPFDYCWRKWGDLHTLIKVTNEAKRQGRSIFTRHVRGRGE